MANSFSDNKKTNHYQIPLDEPSDKLPSVSVVIPTFNRPGRLSNAINSVLTQTFLDYEVIIVNDCGINVDHVIKEFDDDRLIYVQHNQNLGLSSARNTGIKTAKGKYIAYLDDDDQYYPNHLSTLTGFLENNPDTQVAYSDSIFSILEKVNGKYVQKSGELWYSRDFDYDRILYENYIPVLCVMHRKDCLDKVELFDTNLLRTEDWDLWMRMAKVFNFAHIAEVTCQVNWRNDETTMSGKVKEQRPIWDFAELNIYYKHLDIIKTKPKISDILHKRIEDYLVNIRNTLLNGWKSNNPNIYEALGFDDLDYLINRFYFLMDSYGDDHHNQFLEVILILKSLAGIQTIDKEMIVGILTKMQEKEQSIDSLEKQLMKHSQVNPKFNAELQEQQKTIQNLIEQLKELEKTIKDLNLQLAQKEQEILFYSQSKSWKITSPLRKFLNLFRGQGNK